MPSKSKPNKRLSAASPAGTSAPAALVRDVRGILRQARGKAHAVANAIMVEAYWRIGQRIVTEEQGGKARAMYGERLIPALARSLGDEFGAGVSVANLWNFRQFYLAFPDPEKLYALRRELTWSHYRLVMRVDDPAARDWYMDEAADQGWSTRQLERQILTSAYRRLVKKPTPRAPAKGKRTHPAADTTSTSGANAAGPNPRTFLKDPLVLEFLGIPEPIERSERDLESAIISRLQHFLLELGKGFSFVGRQVRISSETSHFYIDLVFYNYLLKCFVLIDLKTTKLTHQDIGQMDMYVRMFDDLKRGEGDNPTLGIILCADKDDTVVRYSVLSERPQLFASKYRLVLPSEDELAAELERRHVLDVPEMHS
jgi:predicted nuclease of restriction endonuclease-like (RecB) superfamily